jgi:hypothetical protein
LENLKGRYNLGDPGIDEDNIKTDTERTEY